MDYKEAYYSLIERLKKAKEDNALCDERYCCVIDGLIQEPEESERIRKAISQCVEDMRGQFEKLYRVHHKDAIAWLEKQGIKPQGKSALESIKEEKVDNANKIEPKFNEGDWLCEIEPNNYARFIQILETVNIQGKERYRISRDIHNDEDIVEFDFVEKYYHKFDIQDAKDGDILYSLDSKQPFIYKIRKPFNQAEAYCGINIFGKFFVWNTKDCAITLDKYIPAAKEQRDLLFQKMREEGYKWDAEKKELEKIEQEPTDADNKFIRMRETKPKDISEFLDRLTTVEQEFLWEHIAKIRDLDKEEQKSSWSEEDKRIMSAISQLLKDCESENDWNCVYSNDREVFFCRYRKMASVTNSAILKK